MDVYWVDYLRILGAPSCFLLLISSGLILQSLKCCLLSAGWHGLNDTLEIMVLQQYTLLVNVNELLSAQHQHCLLKSTLERGGRDHRSSVSSCCRVGAVRRRGCADV